MAQSELLVLAQVVHVDVSIGLHPVLLVSTANALTRRRQLSVLGKMRTT
ncbi:hypothetical protein X764_28565 [Mesorhizobium sp. LSHC440A00]|nr:hypothetical protein X764_28565 [Mesorhizobium sp. LSHC440A00]